MKGKPATACSRKVYDIIQNPGMLDRRTDLVYWHLEIPTPQFRYSFPQVGGSKHAIYSVVNYRSNTLSINNRSRLKHRANIPTGLILSSCYGVGIGEHQNKHTFKSDLGNFINAKSVTSLDGMSKNYWKSNLKCDPPFSQRSHNQACGTGGFIP